jgi:hypothetical protein
MVHAPQHPFNPCSPDDEDEQTAAKIWELLRRNRDFRDVVQQLSKLDAKERNGQEKTGKEHGAAWEKSCRLVRRVAALHPFAGIALQWLVPEPLFVCWISEWKRGKKSKERQITRIGEGTTPDITDTNWVWRDTKKPGAAGHCDRRGPVVQWTTSRRQRLRDPVNPISEWRRYPWPFTVEHSWKEAPAQFRREFQFIWRNRFDSRPTNPITKDRSDSPRAQETGFFHDGKVQAFSSPGQSRQDDLFNAIRFSDLSTDYRVFAIPKTILTKGSADVMGKWLADELKKGSRLWGDLLKDGLFSEGELFGTTTEWTDWLSHQSGLSKGIARDTHFYRRCRYMNSLVDLIYPRFEIARLLAPPSHRARGKKYVRK